MNILFFNWRDIKNPVHGGAEVYLHEIAKRLVQKGHHVSLFSAAFRGCQETECIDGITIIRKGNRYTVYRQAKRYYQKHDNDFDTVVDSINTVPFMTPTFVNKSTRLVAIIYQLAREFWFHETPFPLNMIGYHFLEKRWLKCYTDTKVVSISKSSLDDLRQLGYNRLHMVPIGINVTPLSAIPEKEQQPTLIFVGRMGRAKCPDHILDAFVHIKEEVPQAQLWMVGDGAMRKELESRTTPDITFFGRVDEKKKYELLSRSHCILVPGVREGWGMVVTEANAWGTPAVGYNIHGLRDSIRDGSTGLLCDPSPSSMAQKAIAVLRDNDLRSRLTESALAWSKEFTWDKSTEEFLQVLEEQ